MRFILASMVVPALLSVRAAGVAAQGDPSNQAGYGTPTAVMVSGPDVGRRAPDFTLPWASRDGVGPAESPYQLYGDRGKTVVIAFFPRAFTKTSTAEMRTFAEQYDSLFGPDVVVLGISEDSLPTLSRFASSLGLPFRLLSDGDQRAARKYGSNSSGSVRRTVYVVGPDGRVKYRDLNFDALEPRDYAELGRAVRSARGG